MSRCEAGVESRWPSCQITAFSFLHRRQEGEQRNHIYCPNPLEVREAETTPESCTGAVSFITSTSISLWTEADFHIIRWTLILGLSIMWRFVWRVLRRVNSLIGSKINQHFSGAMRRKFIVRLLMWTSQTCRHKWKDGNHAVGLTVWKTPLLHIR